MAFRNLTQTFINFRNISVNNKGSLVAEYRSVSQISAPLQPKAVGLNHHNLMGSSYKKILEKRLDNVIYVAFILFKYVLGSCLRILHSEDLQYFNCIIIVQSRGGYQLQFQFRTPDKDSQKSD